MSAAGRRWGRRQRALLWGVLLAALEAAWGQLRYSVPEEMPKGSFVGDVAKDLGLQLPALRDRGVHILDKGRTQYFVLHGKTGHLVTAERIDREQLCERVPQCVLRCELIVEGEMQVYGIQVEITDINDNAPSFREAETELKMSETTPVGSRFFLAEAHDPDSGRNSLQSYELSGDEHFSLAVQAGPGGDQRPELVLAKALDREEAAFHELVLRASDGGDPARTGTALLAASSGALRGVPVSHFVGIDGVRAFLQSYSHEVSLTADSRKSQLRFSGASCCDTLPARPLPDEPAPLLGDENSAGAPPADSASVP
ncbi:protocadherin gamma-A12-like, partial [Malurus melanocephalus]|uniref:protocadherin gamma-A12-like n=1 Tax=Malurus melanocephalus TaxID=175006 RepID=UPI002548343A